MFEWLKKLFRRNGENDDYFSNHGAYYEQDLEYKVDNLKTRSNDWTEEDDLKEIVEVIYALNKILLDMQTRMSQLERMVSSNSSKIKLLSSTADIHDSGDRVSHRPEITENKRARTEARININPARDIKTIPEVENLDVLLMNLKKYSEMFGKILDLLANRPQITNDYRDMFVSPLKNVEEEKNRLLSLGVTNPEVYKNLTEKMKDIPIRQLSLNLCASLETEIEAHAESRDTVKKAGLAQGLNDIVGFMKWEIIMPEAGTNYNEDEHDIVDHHSGNVKNQGTINKVYKRGYKNTGGVIEKAKVRINS